MTAILRLGVLLISLFSIAATPVQAQSPAYADVTLARDALRYEALVLKQPGANDLGVRQLRRRADRALANNNARAAIGDLMQAARLQPERAVVWYELSKALLAVQKPTNNRERYQLRENAGGAAYKAYQLSKGVREKARALAVAARVLRFRSYWRPALNAYSASLALGDNGDVRRAYDELRSQRGFRIVNYNVESDAVSPRLCVQFSEPLKRSNTDFAQYVSVDGKDPASVRAEGSQLCVEGIRHGERYQVSVRAGLPSVIAAEPLQKTAQLTIYVRDRSPSVRFTGRNYVLPSTGQRGVPLVSVNTETVALEIFRVGDRNLTSTVLEGDFNGSLAPYKIEKITNTAGARVWKGSLGVVRKLNSDVTTAVSIGKAVPSLKPGVYIMTARAKEAKVERWTPKATQWFVVSDLGLTALSGGDGVHALVRSLATAEAVAGADVRLVARNNEILGTGTTDAQGHVRFPAGITKGEGGSAPALLVAQRKGQDYVFLNLATSAFDLTDRGVDGRAPGGPLEAYLFTERGIYRPGGDVHLTALLRDQNADGVPSVPLTLKIFRPDGGVHRELVWGDAADGGRVHTLSLARSAMTGTWRARVYTDPKRDAVGQTSFLVEDFEPERLDLTIDAATDVLTRTGGGTLNIAGRYLYGPPAANLAVEGDVLVRLRRGGMKGWPGYTFGVDDQTVSATRGDLAELPRTDADGKGVVAVTLPALPATGRLLEARINLRLREPGGRTIERSRVLPISPGRSAIGIKPEFGAGGLKPNQRAAFRIVRLDRHGKVARIQGASWTLYRITRDYQWYSRNGRWQYEALSYTQKIANGTVGAAESGERGAAKLAMPVEWGRYRLEVAETGADPAISSLTFNAGYYGGGDADTPERLEISLDRKGYKPGDVATLTITSPDAGKAKIAILSDALHVLKEVDVAAGDTQVSLEVKDDWAPGAYVTAFFYRPMDTGQKRMPRRAIGVQWIDLDRTHRTIGIAIDAPAKVKSAATVSLPIQLSGVESGAQAHIVLAAVDVGVLNLTRFKAPAPDDWFYAQRRLGTEIRDLYGRLIDGMNANRGVLRSGGDGEGGGTVGHEPPKEKPVALFSGLVKVDANGRATVTFELPEFNGTLRLMAVAWSKGKTGHATKDLIVRDPVALVVTAPRFLTLGDTSRLQIDLHNVEGPAADYAVVVNTDGGGANLATVFSGTVALKAEERTFVRAPLRAEQIGSVRYSIDVTGPDGIHVARTVTLDVKAPGGNIRRRTVARIKPGGRLVLDDNLIGDLIPASATVSLSVGPMARFDVAGIMSSLDRYPYRCAEQTTSRALPLLYLSSLTGRTGVASSGVTKAALKGRVVKAIERLMELQSTNGGFGLWGPRSPDMWLTAYVTDFLTRAREEKYDVPARPLSQALDRLQNFVNYAGDFKDGGESVAYGLYVLARNGRVPVGELRYYADTRLKNFRTPLAKAQLGAALAMYGDQERARQVLNAATGAIAQAADDNRYRGDFGSSLRDMAGALTLVRETGIGNAHVPRMTQLIAAAYQARSHTSTQENAWMLLAARAQLDEKSAMTVTLDGVRQNGHLQRTFDAAALTGQPIVLGNPGADTIDAVITVEGDATTPEPAIAHGFRIERSYFTLDGKAVDLASSDGGTGTLRQNQRLVVMLRVEETEARGGRLLLVDNLPAGLEIENPRIVSGGETGQLSWLKTASPVRPVHTEFRKDRFVASFEPKARQTRGKMMSVAYVVRAVNPGHFVHPAATIEDMYRPERFARTAAGTLTVEAAR